MKLLVLLLTIAVIDAAFLPKSGQQNEESGNTTHQMFELRYGSVRAPRAQGRDIRHYLHYRTRYYPSSYEYMGIENVGENNIMKQQSKGVSATISKSVVDAKIGKSAYGIPDFPPGFIQLRQDGKCPHRGQLLARELGASGIDVRNIVTLTEQVNINRMSKYERLVANIWDRFISEKCIVLYRVTVSYESGQLHPKKVNMDAKIYNPFDRMETLYFNVDIQNEPVPPPANVRHHNWHPYTICTPTPKPKPNLGVGAIKGIATGIGLGSTLLPGVRSSSKPF